jgi:adenine-specific DNA-methyltransferase
MNRFLNKIFQIDNIEILKLLPDNSIDLIYSDVLYGTNSNDIKDYDDKQFKNSKDVLAFYKPRFIEIKRVLKETGSIYIHCDWHYSHYLKVLMDSIFGIENFKNDIIRQCTNAKNNSKNWGRIYDNILYYTMSDNYTWNYIMEQKTEAELEKQFNKKTEDGRYFTTVPLHAKGETNGVTGKDWEHPERGTIKLPSGRHWATTPDKLLELDNEGGIAWSRNNVPRRIQFADEYDSKYIQNIWDLKSIGSRKSYISKGGLIYDTQKPFDLLKRIILQSSNEGDVVLDLFCGSGVTCEVSKEFNRNYIGCDLTEKSMEICKNKGLDVNFLS